MARRSPKIVSQSTPSFWKLLSVTAALVACSLTRADEPVAGESVLPSPMSAETASFTTAVSIAEKLWQDRPLGSLKATIRRTEGEVPPNIAAPRLAESGLIFHSFGDSRPWMLTSCEWEAPATRHLPLLFEEPNLERLGYHQRCCCDCCCLDGSCLHGCCAASCLSTSCLRECDCLQSIVSGAHFFGSIAIVPYKAGYQCLCEPVYTLGVDRPGSPVCYRKHRCPLSLKGALYQAGFVTGMVFLIP